MYFVVSANYFILITRSLSIGMGISNPIIATRSNLILMGAGTSVSIMGRNEV